MNNMAEYVLHVPDQIHFQFLYEHKSGGSVF